MANLLDSLTAAQAEFTGQARNYYQQTQNVTEAIAANADKQAEITTAIKSQEIADNAKAINVGRILATALGANPEATNYRMENLHKEKAAATDEAIAATNEYAKLASTNFLDNPFEWIINQFQKDAVAEKANAATVRSNLATSEIASINDEIQQGVMTSKIVSETVNQELVAKQLDNASITAKQAANDLKLKGLRDNSQALAAVMSGNSDQMQAIMHQESLTMQQQNQAFQREQANAQKEQWQAEHELRVRAHEDTQEQRAITNDFRAQQLAFSKSKWGDQQEQEANNYLLKLEKQIADAEKSGNKNEAAKLKAELVAQKRQFDMDKAIAEKQGLEETVNAYRQVAAALGADTKIYISDNLYAAQKDIEAGLKRANNPKDASDIVWKAVKNSIGSSLALMEKHPDAGVTISYGLLATDALEAISVIRPKLTEEQKNTYNYIRYAYDKIRQELLPTRTSYANDLEFKLAIDEKLKSQFEAMTNAPDEHELYNVPTPAELINNTAYGKNSNFAQEYIKPLVVEHDTDLSANRVLKLINKAMSDGKMNLNQAAAEMTQLYSAATMYNNGKNGYALMGIPGQQSYNIHGIGDRVLNGMDITDAKTMIITSRLESGGFGFGLLLKEATPWIYKDILKSELKSKNPAPDNK